MSGLDFENINVLVVDDSRPMRSLLTGFLFGFGVNDVFEAPDAEIAYEKLCEHNPDIVITDWRMPPTDGIQLVERIRTSVDSPNPYLPIIMLTGFTEVHRVKQARDAGVTAFLAKPVSAESLYKRLCSVIDDKRPFVRVGGFFGPDRRVPHRDKSYDGADRRYDDPPED